MWEWAFWFFGVGSDLAFSSASERKRGRRAPSIFLLNLINLRIMLFSFPSHPTTDRHDRCHGQIQTEGSAEAVGLLAFREPMLEAAGSGARGILEPDGWWPQEGGPGLLGWLCFWFSSRGAPTRLGYGLLPTQGQEPDTRGLPPSPRETLPLSRRSPTPGPQPHPRTSRRPR